jgi:hypothetical protein
VCDERDQYVKRIGADWAGMRLVEDKLFIIDDGKGTAEWRFRCMLRDLSGRWYLDQRTYKKAFNALYPPEQALVRYMSEGASNKSVDFEASFEMTGRFVMDMVDVIVEMGYTYPDAYDFIQPKMQALVDAYLPIALERGL